MTNVAPLLSTLFCRNGLSACRGFLICLIFFYITRSFFRFLILKDFFYFLCIVQVVRCVYYTCFFCFVLGGFFWPKNLCSFCDCSEKSNGRQKGNMNTKSRKENIFRVRDALLLCCCLPRRNPTHVSSCEFCCGYVHMSKDQGWRSIPLAEKPESISTEVHFHCLK